MTITPNELLETSIGQLRTLADFLREQLDHGADSPPSGAAQVRACREVLGSLGVLILRLQATREMLTGVEGPEFRALSLEAWSPHSHERLSLHFAGQRARLAEVR